MEKNGTPISAEKMEALFCAHPIFQGTEQRIIENLIKFGSDGFSGSASPEKSLGRGIGKLFNVMLWNEVSGLKAAREAKQDSDKPFSLPSVFPEHQDNSFLNHAAALGRGIEKGRDGVVNMLIHPIDTAAGIGIFAWDMANIYSEVKFGISSDASMLRNDARLASIVGAYNKFDKGDSVVKTEMLSELFSGGVLAGAYLPSISTIGKVGQATGTAAMNLGKATLGVGNAIVNRGGAARKAIHLEAQVAPSTASLGAPLGEAAIDVGKSTFKTGKTVPVGGGSVRAAVQRLEPSHRSDLSTKLTELERNLAPAPSSSTQAFGTKIFERTLPGWEYYRIQDRIVKLNPKDIFFSQNSVNDASKLASKMRDQGWKWLHIDVVKMPDGRLITLDNTRLLAAHTAGIEVNAVVRGYHETLNKMMADRFQTTKGGIPVTWGEAVQFRINKQSSGYRLSNPRGSFSTCIKESM